MENKNIGPTLQRPSSYIYVAISNTTLKAANIATFSVTSAFPVKEIKTSVQYVARLRSGAPGAYTAGFDSLYLSCDMQPFNDSQGIVCSLGSLKYVDPSLESGYAVYSEDFNGTQNTVVLRDPTILMGQYNLQINSVNLASVQSFTGIVRFELLG